MANLRSTVLTAPRPARTGAGTAPGTRHGGCRDRCRGAGASCRRRWAAAGGQRVPRRPRTCRRWPARPCWTTSRSTGRPRWSPPTSWSTTWTTSATGSNAQACAIGDRRDHRLGAWLPRLLIRAHDGALVELAEAPRHDDGRGHYNAAGGAWERASDGAHYSVMVFASCAAARSRRPAAPAQAEAPIQPRSPDGVPPRDIHRLSAERRRRRPEQADRALHGSGSA